jgi:hypothetical protein
MSRSIRGVGGIARRLTQCEDSRWTIPGRGETFSSVIQKIAMRISVESVPIA